MSIAAPSAGSNESIIYGFLTNGLGFTPAGAAGALGNLQVESGFDPNAWNPSEKARGLAQWEKGRRTGSAGLQAYAAAHGGKETDLAMQLGYMAQELRSGYTGVLSAMRRATDPAAAAALWDQNYEASSGSTRTQRVNNAQTIYQQIKQGQLTATSAPAGTPSGAAGFVKDKPPYATTPAPPYTPAQRKAMLAYAKKVLANDPTAQGTDWNHLSDQELQIMYTLALSAGSGTAPPGQIIGDLAGGLFGGIKGLVIKTAFALGGIGLVVVGANAAAKRTGEK